MDGKMLCHSSIFVVSNVKNDLETYQVLTHILDMAYIAFQAIAWNPLAPSYCFDDFHA